MGSHTVEVLRVPERAELPFRPGRTPHMRWSRRL